MSTLTTLATFNGTNGEYPNSGLIADASGNLFGMTDASGAGANGYGTVFEIAKTATGYASTPTTLATFNATNGAFPNFGSLIFDAKGDLFGVTSGNGGQFGYGTVFEIAKTATGYASTPTILLSFNGNNGFFPVGGLIADASGNLFGTTAWGGVYGYGTVFEIAYNVATGYATAPITLVNFNGSNGYYATDSPIGDANGNLFGTTSEGGTNNLGTVFEIAKTATGYASTPTTLATFNGTNGSSPEGSLLADASGNLFGTTATGGANGDGTVFEIPKTALGYAPMATLVSFNFNGAGGVGPASGLIADASGNLFGTTDGGSANNLGTVFEIVKTATGYASTPTTLFSFNGTNGQWPVPRLLADANGNLFGTTETGGANNLGTVFELSDTGFQVATPHPNPKAGNAHLYIAPGQTVDLTNQLLALDIPGLLGDTLALTAAGTSGTHGTVKLNNGDMVYTAPPSGSTDAFTYTVSDQYKDTAIGNVSVSLNANLAKNANIGLTGSGNIVVGANGNNAIMGGAGSNWIVLGNGNDSVSLPGNNNTVALGNGNDTVYIDGSGDSVTVGSGHDAIRTGPHGGNDTFILNGSSTALVLHGSNNKVFINGGKDTVVDTPGSTDKLLLQVGVSGGQVSIADFSATNGVVDLATTLASGLRWTTPSQIASALTSDHHGGALLSLGSHGSIDFLSVVPSALHGANFQIG